MPVAGVRVAFRAIRPSLLLVTMGGLMLAGATPLLTRAQHSRSMPPSGPGRPAMHQVKLNGHTFTLPEGFIIELAADSRLVPRPITAALDERGRLYVGDSSGSNEPVQVQLQKKPHRIVRLEDSNGDGVFDRATVFVKNVMFPEGTLWYNGSLYVAAPPHILKFTDLDDDGVADKEEIWFDGKTLTGCANDLHGPYLGPDGYFYWCKGAFARQEYTLPNGRKLVTRAAHIFRATPDGKQIEPVITGGMDNPVDVVFLPDGEMIFSTTFFQHPGNGQRDGLIHAVYGGVYGKDHDPIYEHPWTAPQLMPVLTHMGPAAPCGLHCYTSDQFGPEYRFNLFCCQFNLRKVSRHVLTRQGSTYVSQDSDFLVSDNIDFHPTDVLEDRDGSLLVLDTGGWYKICCPTSQFMRPEVTGAIYRIRKLGGHQQQKAAGMNRPPLPRLRQIALQRDARGMKEAIAALRSGDPFERRWAAEALGRIGQAQAVPALLEALADPSNDRALDHALTYALLEIGDAAAVASGLRHDSPRVRRAVLTVLSYLPATRDDPQPVLAALNDADAQVRATAWWIAGRHPQWGDKLAGYFRAQLRQLERLEPNQRQELAERLGRFVTQPVIQEVVAEAARQMPTASLALNVMAHAGLKTLPPSWQEALCTLAPQLTTAAGYEAALAVFRQFALTTEEEARCFVRFQAAVPSERLWSGGQPPLQLRLLALAARSPRLPLTDTDFTLLLQCLRQQQENVARTLAAAALARGTLTAAQLQRLAAALPDVHPMDLPKLLDLFARTPQPEALRTLLEVLQQPACRQLVRREMLQPIFDKAPTLQEAAQRLYTLLEQDRAADKARLEQLLAELQRLPGDVRRGQQVFHSAKANCLACHKVGYVGGTIGPDLTRIGTIRSERDLLEAIVFPSASFVRSYEPVRIVTTDERVFNGLIARETPEEIILTVAADKQERLPRRDIASMTPGTISLMPAGLDQQLTRQELADLLAFLKACR
ncbi:MAG: c-type cytochrome [Thermogemmata sp.]|nr:c-type cytochrome [Thermogemmata sp.]